MIYHYILTEIAKIYKTDKNRIGGKQLALTYISGESIKRYNQLKKPSGNILYKVKHIPYNQQSCS